jgi:hypothetical protein
VNGYTGSRAAVCPDTGADLQDEGFAYWCPACRTSHPFSYVVLPGDIDDD